MSEPLLPESPPETSSHWNPTPWLCPEDGVILQNVRPTDEGWVGDCPVHGSQLGVQRTEEEIASQEPENDPEEEEL